MPLPVLPSCVAVVVAAALSPGSALFDGPLELESGPLLTDSDLEAFDCDGDVIFEQLPNGTSVAASQDDICYPFAAETADDFVADGSTVTAVGWWGRFWNGSPEPVEEFRLSIYADDDGKPGTLLVSTDVATYEETPGKPIRYCATIPPFTGEAGITYHLSIQAVTCFPPQWGWATGKGNGVPAHFRSELFDVPEWVTADEIFPGPYEMAVVLHAEPAELCCHPDGTCEKVPIGTCDGGVVADCMACSATPVNRTSFGGIKALYRGD